MADTFLRPDFSNGDIELRIEDDNVCIYATDAGLGKIISFCESLMEAKGNEHIHLEDYAILTEKSLKGVIARFEKMERNS